ncbi:MAG TPA: amidohydrolase family protein [Gemmatimonadaceae bacterium]|nr:amidohydrolase family protein [Gemmatimonadaceae bacterium]
MTTRIVAATVLLLWPALVRAQGAPVVDHHQHLFSPALAAAMSPPAPAPPTPPSTAADLVALLDAAGIKRAVVLSTGYIFEQPSRKIENAADKLRADHDWTSQQVAQYPGRLLGFCGLNPLKDYALDELARCAKDPNLRNGLKLHFGNSVVDYHNAQHIEQVKRVFRAANGYRMPIVVHMRASLTAKLPYGRDEALIFLNELVPAAPDVVIQVAHLAAAGAPSDPGADQAIEAFIEAIANGDARATRLYFDAPSVVPTATLTAEAAAALASRIRRLGVQRVLFGSDAPTGGALTPRTAWESFRKLPLTEAEFQTIAANVAPYLR